MQLTDIARTVLQKRYLKKVDGRVVEEPEDMLRRVARTIAEIDGDVYGKSAAVVEQTAEAFFQLMDSRDFMPNSPTLMNAGRDLGQLSACFVLPVGDSMTEIFDTVKHAALIHQSGGGTGFAFSQLRPAGDVVRSTGGVASGPISFMKVFNAATEAVKQGGTRRGANMGILRIDHPDIMEFITCKQDTTQVTNFNISVAVTDEFMQAVENDDDYALINPRSGEVVGSLSAREVFAKLVECAWATGEPGMIFIDRVNAENPTAHAELIESTNPCGEQPLGPYESCNLGSINLLNFVVGKGKGRDLDWSRLAEVTYTCVHFLDNVIDANRYPLPQIEQKTKANRRIGLGVMGWADLLIKLEIAYDSDAAVELAGKVMQFIWDESVKASEQLAAERGVFPNWQGSLWDQKGRRVRNATLTTVAPTGTISMIAGCSSGIEPIFALVFTRNQAGVTMLDVNHEFERIAQAEGWYSDALMETILERGTCRGLAEVPEKWQRVFACAYDITPAWHVRMQGAFQTGGVDSAVSKTINFAKDATVEDVHRAYILAYELGCKGITVYRDGSREGQVLSVGKQKEEAAVVTVPLGPALAPRPQEAMGKMFIIPTHFGKMTLDVHMDEEGNPFEVICSVGAAGSDLMADAVALGMITSILMRLRSDVPWQERLEIVVDKLKNIGGSGAYGFGPTRVTSLASALAKGLQRFLDWKQGRKNAEAAAAAGTPVIQFPKRHEGPVDPCPDCGSHALVVGEGCHTCQNCGYSRCN